MEQKTISEPKESTQEHINDVVDKTLKLESPTEKAWREMEEQMKSPEGLEGMKLPEKERREPANLSEIIRKQGFLKEFWKWEGDHTIGAMGIIGDLPTHIDTDVKFKNKNKFEIPVEFADYLISNALDGASVEVLKELKNILKELDEIIFYDILESKDLLLVTLKSKSSKMSLVFEVKYPFKFRAGKSFRHE